MKKLNKQVYLQVLGLMELAKQASAQLDYLERTIAQLLNVKAKENWFYGVSDHVFDVTDSVRDTDKMLEQIGYTK